MLYDLPDASTLFRIGSWVGTFTHVHVNDDAHCDGPVWTNVPMRLDVRYTQQVISAFNLAIKEEDLMTRCIRCNGDFIPTPLSASQAVAAAPPSQSIAECVLKQVNEYWQCGSCKHLYWEVRQGMCSLY